ncbi:MAG: hypothetical protein OXT09_29845 [Myxococcales bacterium]|nr:hypothetical protein [Myxococcales bacterium]
MPNSQVTTGVIHALCLWESGDQQVAFINLKDDVANAREIAFLVPAELLRERRGLLLEAQDSGREIELEFDATDCSEATHRDAVFPVIEIKAIAPPAPPPPPPRREQVRGMIEALEVSPGGDIRFGLVGKKGRLGRLWFQLPDARKADLKDLVLSAIEGDSAIEVEYVSQNVGQGRDTVFDVDRLRLPNLSANRRSAHRGREPFTLRRVGGRTLFSR